jgi:hypothetical protein
MAKEQEEFDMSLFDSDSELEINLDFNPEELDLEEQEENQEDEPIEDNLDEDESSEEVVEEEEDQQEGEDNSPNLYSSFATVLNEQGLLPSLDLDNEKIESLDDLTKVLKSEINTQVKEYLVEKIGEQGYEALEKGISLAEYQEHQDNNETLNSITEESLENNLELSKEIIKRDYLAQGMPENRVNRILKKIIDSGDEAILEDAKISLESLKAFEQKRIEQLQVQKEQQIQQQKELQEKIDNDLKNSIYNKKEFIEGVPVNKSVQDKVYKSITTIVGKSPTGVAENKLMKDRRENPIEFDSKLYYLYEITNGFKDFSKIVTKSKTTASQQLEQQLRNQKFETQGKPAFLDDPNSYGGIGSELVL